MFTMSNSVNMKLSKLWEIAEDRAGVLQSMGATKSQTKLNKWTTTV